MQRNLKWTVMLLALCIVLALLGSVNVGHAALGEKNQVTSAKLASSGQRGNTPLRPGKTPAPTATPRVHPTPAASPSKSRKTSGGTPTATATPVTTTQPQNPTLPPISAPTQSPQAPIQTPNNTQAPTANASTILVQDTFARQDQVTWGSTTDGHIWQGLAATSNIFSISNQQGKVAQANGYFDAITGPSLNNASIRVNGIINFAQSDGTTSIGLVLRWQDSNHWYKAYLDGTTIGIRKRVDSQTSTLVTTGFFVQPGASYTIRFHAIGSLLQVKAWQTSMREPTQWTLTTHDTSLTSGFGGLRIGVQDTTAVYITSFTEKRI